MRDRLINASLYDETLEEPRYIQLELVPLTAFQQDGELVELAVWFRMPNNSIMSGDNLVIDRQRQLHGRLTLQACFFLCPMRLFSFCTGEGLVNGEASTTV